MSVDIPSELVSFVHSIIASGRCRSESEVVGQALRLLEVVERKREQLRVDVLEGINSGESIPGDEVARHVNEWAAQELERRPYSPSIADSLSNSRLLNPASGKSEGVKPPASGERQCSTKAASRFRKPLANRSIVSRR
jgi:putative addiction module CopG family antidote